MQINAETKEKARSLSALAIAVLRTLNDMPKRTTEAVVYRSLFELGHNETEADAVVFALVHGGLVERYESTMLRATEYGKTELGRTFPARRN